MHVPCTKYVIRNIITRKRGRICLRFMTYWELKNYSDNKKTVEFEDDIKAFNVVKKQNVLLKYLIKSLLK